MWKKHRSVLQDHVKYIQNDIVKTFRSGILQYTKRVHEMHDLKNYLPPLQMKGVSFESARWDACDKEFSNQVICVSTKDGIPSSMQDELEDNHEDYLSILNEEWCDLLSTIEVKENSKRAEDQIKRRSSSKGGAC